MMATTKTTLQDGATFEHKGLSFRVSIQHDDTHEPPWYDDGHGIVTDWIDPEAAEDGFRELVRRNPRPRAVSASGRTEP